MSLKKKHLMTKVCVCMFVFSFRIHLRLILLENTKATSTDCIFCDTFSNSVLLLSMYRNADAWDGFTQLFFFSFISIITAFCGCYVDTL